MIPGTYRLTIDLPAFAPDRRKRHDWRAKPVAAGTLFVVEDRSYEVVHRPERQGKAFLVAYFVAYPSGNCSHMAVRLDKFPADALSPVEETPSMWLSREHGGLALSRSILDRLVADGVVTMEQVQAAAEAVLKERP